MARKSARKLWTDALSGGRVKPTAGDFVCQRGYRGIILGIDPSLRGSGAAVLESNGDGCKFIFSTRLAFPPRITFHECLGKIFREIDAIAERYQPDCAAMENTIFVQNYRIAQILGSVRGAIVASLASRGIEICEYPPLRVKQAVTGVGRASKEQVRRTMVNLLAIGHEISNDESDAMAVACCHAWTFVPSKKSSGQK